MTDELKEEQSRVSENILDAFCSGGAFPIIVKNNESNTLHYGRGLTALQYAAILI